MDGQDYVLTIKGSPHAEKIRRSLTTLFDTRESSQPGDRDFGLSWQCLDEPPEVAESMMAMEIIRKVDPQPAHSRSIPHREAVEQTPLHSVLPES